MSRATRLAVGVLLLVIAGVFVLMGEPPNKNLDPLLLPSIFGVPGLLMLLWGLVPPKGKSMVFLPTRLAGGLGLSMAGLGLVFVFHQITHVMPRFLLVGGMLAVPIGLLLAATCWAEVQDRSTSKAS